MPLLTRGFRPSERALHFKRHGAKLSIASEMQYELQADMFLGGMGSPAMLQGIRPDGDMVRFDPATGKFGSLGADRFIRTYFVRDPKNVAENLRYFQDQCVRKFP